MLTENNDQVIYDSSRVGFAALDELKSVFNYRHLIIQLTRRDITTRYRRSVLGVAWTMLNPLGMMIVLTVAFSSIFRFDTEFSYAAYVLTGYLAWNFFAQTSNAAMANLVWGGSILRRIYIPRTSFALAAVGTGLVNICLSIVPLLLVMLVTGVPLTPSALFTPVAILLLAVFSLGVGLILSTIAVFFPDVSEMYQILLTAWMYLTPIIYPESVLPEQYRTLITHINPMYYLLKVFRMPLYNGQLPAPTDILLATLIAVIALALGWYVFSKKSDELAYRI